MSVDGERGTVRYIGEVASSKTVGARYAGIEWDTPSRGKNNGSVVDSQGVTTRYFTCPHERGASFVKLELVTEGRTFEAALVERYCDVSTGSDSGALVGVSGKAVPVVLVGDDKVREQQALGKLTHVVLRDASVSVVGDVKVCPKVREVDLQGNLIESWEEVAALGKALPLLRVLNLSDNRLPPLTEEGASSIAGCLPGLKTFIVSDTGIDWASITRLSLLAPGLEEIHATGCGLTTLTPSPSLFNHNGDASVDAFLPPHLLPKVKTLNLSNNPLQWSQVFSLGRMPCLTWLLLNDCGLTQVWTTLKKGTAGPSSPLPSLAVEDLPPFAHLEQLSISGSSITSPWVLDGLDSFPSLRSLRLGNSDFFLPLHPPLGPVEARQVIIARCPRLTALCGSEVRLREREDAEKAYARRVAVLFAESIDAKGGVTDVFGTHTVGPQPEFNLLAPPTPSTTTLSMATPVGFSKGSDSGIIRARGGDFVVGGAEAHYTSTNPFIRSPIPLIAVSAAPSPTYHPELDPWGLGGRDVRAAAAIQALFPRFFLLAAKFDLLAPGKSGVGGLAGGTLASSSIPLLIRSMAGSSCTADPVARRLPLSTTVLEVKQMAGKLFKCDIALQRLSFRESSHSYPTLLDDDQRPISYFGVCADGEILVEEINPAGKLLRGSMRPHCSLLFLLTLTILTLPPSSSSSSFPILQQRLAVKKPRQQKLKQRRWLHKKLRAKLYVEPRNKV